MDLFGNMGFFTDVSKYTNNYPRFTSPIVRIILKHIFGSHLEQLGSKDEAIAFQAHALSSTSTKAITVITLFIQFIHSIYSRHL